MTDKFAWGPDTVLSQCLLCKHTSGHVAICAAFPGSIPDEIMMNQVDHRRPYPGDEGVALAGSIVFEPRGGVNPITLQRSTPISTRSELPSFELATPARKA